MVPTIFYDTQHKSFYEEMLKQSRQDAYHRALFYTLGISRDTRVHVRELFDFSNDSIRTKGLMAAWQTGSSIRVCRLAFNLWNGWTEEGQERYSAPHELFDCSYAPYFLVAIHLRYPEYCKSHERNAHRITGQAR